MQPLPLEERKSSFKEIEAGLSKEEALGEAKRCLQCKEAGCTNGCPAGVDCREFIRLLAEGKQNEALEKVMEKNPLPCISSRVCPVEIQCEGNCVLAKAGKEIKIHLLERFVSEKERSVEKAGAGENSGKGKKAAVIGSGPAGLTAALELAERGFAVKVFEADGKAGGMPLWGIPRYKLPVGIVEREVERAQGNGIEFEVGKKVGKDLMLSDLQREYSSVVVCTGETIEKRLDAKGENLKGVFYWTDFLRKFNGSSERFDGKKAVIIGGGDTAMDCARVAVRLGLETVIAYRKTREFMPCQKKEVEEAEREGAGFEFLLSPVEFLGEGKVEKVLFQKARIEGEQFIATQEMVELEADFAIIAIGQQQDNTVLQGTELQGKQVEASSFSLPLERVFAAGDVANREKTVAHSIFSAKQAVKEIAGEMR